MVSLRIPSIPTSNDVGFLPRVLTSLDKQVQALDAATVAGKATSKQKLVAWATGSVFVAVLSLVDEVAHLASFVIKAPGVGIKQLAKITNLGKYVTSPALDVQDWLGHLSKARAVVFVAVSAIFYGLPNDLHTVISTARNVELIAGDASKVKKKAGGTTATAGAAS